jgi:restriction system protein
MLVGEGFRLQGYQVVETGSGGADGGVDLVLTKPGKNGGEKFLVQCNQWRAFKVGVDVMREMYGVMAARGATGGFVVTSGRFTDEAISFASGRNVNLVDGPKLYGLIRRAKAGIDGSPARSSSSSSAGADPAAAQPGADAGGKLPPFLEAGGAAGGQARCQCRQRVLGLYGLPGMRGTRPIA